MAGDDEKNDGSCPSPLHLTLLRRPQVQTHRETEQDREKGRGRQTGGKHEKKKNSTPTRACERSRARSERGAERAKYSRSTEQVLI